MKKITTYVVCPHGYDLPIAQCDTMKQVRKVLRRNKNKWLDVHKYIHTKSMHGYMLAWKQFYKYLGESHEQKK